MTSDPFRDQLEKALPNLHAKPELLGALQSRMLLKMYVEMRGIKKDVEAQNKLRLNPVKQTMERIEAFLLGRLAKDGASSLNTSDGTAIKKTRRYVKVVDWSGFIAWAQETDHLGLLKKDVSSTELSAYVDAHPDDDLPPGISITCEDVINIRKPR